MNNPTKFDSLAFYVFLILVFVLPFFFIPSTSVPFQNTKTILVVMSTLVIFFAWIISLLKNPSFKVYKTSLIPVVLALSVVAILAGLFSGNFAKSFIGQGFEVGTMIFITVLVLLLFITPYVLKNRDRILYVYLAFISSFLLLAFFQIGRLVFGENFLSFGIFNSVTQNPLGNWSELGIFFGLSAMLSVITLELLTFTRGFRVLLYIALALSLFLSIVVNFSSIWYVLGVFSIVFFVYLISFSVKKVSYISLVTLLVSLVLIFGGDSVSAKINDYFKVQNVDVRPSWSATFSVAKNTLKENSLLGSGPNRFANEWLKWKPTGLNNTVFWNTDFNYGIGLIPTFLVTQGVLGMIAWIVFLALFIWVGFKSIFKVISDSFSRYLIISSFFVALYLWIFSVIYIPSSVLFTFAFIFTGIFIASLAHEGFVKTTDIKLFEEPKTGFISILSLILVLILSVTVGYVSLRKYVASIYYNSSLVEFNKNADLSLVLSGINSAVKMSPSDLYYRSLSDIDIARMNELLNKKDISNEEMRTAFQDILGNAISNAEQAITIDSTNYQNWMSLGRVYETVLPLGVSSAYENANVAYSQALNLNPQSPALLLILARLDIANKKFDTAKQYISRALNAKNDYTEAIFLLAQIQVNEGNIKDAISSVEAAAFISPNDSGVFFQLGVLRYSNKDYKGAIDALGRAVALNDSYSNARYFLGLSFAQLGDYAGAVDQFKVIEKFNPDNEEIKLILKNLLAGKSPFTNATPPVDSKPEKRSTLPIKEK
ncbi:MAG: tetratricopeptide repeat protein [Patescibacteria group bacterium]|nr:tetratricopeptide repeat protein [Patescibacteria group bacterium]